jgi:hypothetical protein
MGPFYIAVVANTYKQNKKFGNSSHWTMNTGKNSNLNYSK